MSQAAGRKKLGTRGRVVAAAVAVVVVVVAILLLGGRVGGEGGDRLPGAGASPQASARPTPSASTSDPADEPGSEPAESPAPTAAPDGSGAAPSAPPAEGVITLPPLTDTPPEVVALDAEAALGSSATARVLGVEEVTASGTGIGEIAGPALLVTLEVTNTGGEDLDLASFNVSAYLGSDAVPASPVTTDDRESPLAGVLSPGESARGRTSSGCRRAVRGSCPSRCSPGPPVKCSCSRATSRPRPAEISASPEARYRRCGTAGARPRPPGRRVEWSTRVIRPTLRVKSRDRPSPVRFVPVPWPYQFFVGRPCRTA